MSDFELKKLKNGCPKCGDPLPPFIGSFRVQILLPNCQVGADGVDLDITQAHAHKLIKEALEIQKSVGTVSAVSVWCDNCGHVMHRVGEI